MFGTRKTYTYTSIQNKHKYKSSAVYIHIHKSCRKKVHVVKMKMKSSVEMAIENRTGYPHNLFRPINPVIVSNSNAISW